MQSDSRVGRTHRQAQGAAKGRPGRESRKPKLIAGLLLLGTIVIGGGGVFAATRPNWTPPPRMTSIEKSRATADAGAVAAPTARAKSAIKVRMKARARTEAPTAKAGTDAKSRSASATASSPPITYTVKSGDTLSGIAEWFKLHGYGSLYKANMAVVGDDPNLIFPGQRITIAHGKMSVRSAHGNGSGE